MNNEITSTLKEADNEGTESPYWLIIDPKAVTGYLRFSTPDDPEGCYTADLDDEFVMEKIEEMIPHCITGPFFCRQDAEGHLKARNYEFSKSAYVYCHSGYWSSKYKAFCRELSKSPTTQEEK